MKILFLLLLVLFLVMLGLFWLFMYLNRERDYLHRSLIYLKKCPFRDGPLAKEILSEGRRRDTEGIISYSLYGNYLKYLPTLLKSLDNIKRLLPKWQARVYVSVEVDRQTRRLLTKQGAHVVVMGPEPPYGHEAATWRFLPAEEDIIFVSADADDLFDLTRRDEILTWLESGQPFASFIPFVTYIPLDAGKWASRGKQVPDIRTRLSKYCEHWFGFDEAFLKTEIWPIAEKKGCYFSSYYRFDFCLPYLWIVFILVFLVLFYMSLF